jgi:N-acetylmuramoyl-L-alanine amidase
MLLRRYPFLIIPTALMLLAPALARADFRHTVVPGESLSSVAATDGLTVDELAAANGLSPNAELITGSTLMIPPQGSGSAASSGGGGGSAGDGDNDSDDSGGGGSSGGAAAGSYVVQPGDTLWAIAHRDGTTVRELAAENGLDPNRLLLSGTVLQLGGGGSGGGSSNASQPVGSAAEGSTAGPPYPTPARVSPSQVGQIAAANGVPPSLAEAIADQESGFNNAVVSPANAIGEMQILPGTWDWIGQTLAGPIPLDPYSATDNVRAGVLLLHSLLHATGGNVGLTAAGYYQGLPSVRARGLYSDTQQYVADVQALRHRFGGP